MPWVLLLFALLSCCPGVASQPVLTQAPSQSTALGNTARLTCSLSSGYESYVISWYQQKAGQPPRLVLDTSGNRAAGIPSRFSGSKSGRDRYLTITSVQGDDEATYYCGADHGSGSSYVYVFGGGTQLTVSGQPRVPPNVHVFGPSEEEKKTKAKATITCLMDGFYPGDATVEWLVDGTPVSSGVETARPTRQGDKYVASSYLTLPVSEWEKHETYACKVTHGGEATEKSVRRSEYR